MALICKDCGCDDIRNHLDIGYARNNCGSHDYKQFVWNNIDTETMNLMVTFRKNLSE